MTAERKSPIPLESMDKGSRARLAALLAKEPSALSDGDKAFLAARRDYLTADQQADFLTDAPTGAEGDKYDDMGKDALKAEAKKRGLAVGGKVDELRARLREADAA